MRNGKISSEKDHILQSLLFMCGRGRVWHKQGKPRVESGGDTTKTWTGKDGPGLIFKKIIKEI